MSYYPPPASVVAQARAATTAQDTPPIQDLTTSPLSRIVGRSFVLALMTCSKDFILSLDQLDWFRELDGAPLQTETVITTAWDLRGDLESLLLARARSCIAGTVHHNPVPFELWSEKWPLGPNWLFALTSKWAFDHQTDFLLVEPDAVPIKPGWFHALRREYYGCGRPFMGHIEPASSTHPQHVAGNACYPWDVWNAGGMRTLWTPFDIQLANDAIIHNQLAHRSPSIFQIWSTVPGSNVPPDFPTIASLDVIPPKTLLFHRCKSSSLIARLREQRNLSR